MKDKKANDKLIADFMEMKYADKRSWEDGEWTHSIMSLSRFHTDWGWIMGVVQKISIKALKLRYEGPISELTIFANKDMVYKAIIKFITWYNEQRGKGN